jgi:hypothetical protein
MLGVALVIALALLGVAAIAAGVTGLPAGSTWAAALDALGMRGPGELMLAVTVLLSVLGLFVAVAAAPARGRR